MRRLLAITAILALTCAAVASSAVASPTRVHVYSPLDPDGTLRDGLSVNQGRTTADCWIGSSVVKGAYRCFEGNLIHDPCYLDDRDPEFPSVLCVESPWSRAAVRLDVVDELPEPGKGSSQTPWALELASGLRSTFMQGATGTLGRFRLNYACSKPRGHRALRFLFGTPSKHRAAWTIRQARDSSGRGLRRVIVRTAWR
jgi:hypothetical protein